MPKRRLSLLLPGLLLVPSLAAVVGGWATISVEQVPDYLTAGKPVTLTFMVRQHGVTPLENLHPRVAARAGKAEAEANAVPGRVAGQYSATFTPSEPGDWAITVQSGFGNSNLKLLPIRALAAGAAPIVLTEAERGRHLFVAKGCVGCHVRADVAVEDAPAIGPELTGRRYPADFLKKFLADPASTGPARTRAGPMPNPHLTPQEIVALAEYINRE